MRNECLIRINPDKTVTTLATAGSPDDSDFSSFEHGHSMNGLGQVAALVHKHGGNTPAVVRLDDGGITEIAVQTAELINFSRPSINDAGVVAFTAFDMQTLGECGGSACNSVYTGTGGTLASRGGSHQARVPATHRSTAVDWHWSNPGFRR